MYLLVWFKTVRQCFESSVKSYQLQIYLHYKIFHCILADLGPRNNLYKLLPSYWKWTFHLNLAGLHHLGMCWKKFLVSDLRIAVCVMSMNCKQWMYTNTRPVARVCVQTLRDTSFNEWTYASFFGVISPSTQCKQSSARMLKSMRTDLFRVDSTGLQVNSFKLSWPLKMMATQRSLDSDRTLFLIYLLTATDWMVITNKHHT